MLRGVLKNVLCRSLSLHLRVNISPLNVVTLFANSIFSTLLDYKKFNPFTLFQLKCLFSALYINFYFKFSFHICNVAIMARINHWICIQLHENSALICQFKQFFSGAFIDTKVLVLDGNSQYVAHALRKKGLFRKKVCFVTSLDLIKYLKQIK